MSPLLTVYHWLIITVVAGSGTIFLAGQVAEMSLLIMKVADTCPYIIRGVF